MEVKAWIQMGSERREVTFDVPEGRIKRVGEDGLEMFIEDQVLEWIRCRFGWGWCCELIRNDFGFMEDGEGQLAVVDEVLNRRTVRKLLPSTHQPGGPALGDEED